MFTFNYYVQLKEVPYFVHDLNCFFIVKFSIFFVYNTPDFRISLDSAFYSLTFQLSRCLTFWADSNCKEIPSKMAVWSDELPYMEWIQPITHLIDGSQILDLLSNVDQKITGKSKYIKVEILIAKSK